MPAAQLPPLAAWAWAVARTRMLDQPVEAFARGRELMPPGAEKAPTLMPLMDLANHAEPNASNVRLSSVNGTLSFTTTRDVAAGEELRFTYIDSVGEAEEDESLRDEMCNDQWLSHYGFLLEDGRPERDCFYFELSVPRLRALLAADGGGGAEAAARARGERRRLADAELSEALHTVIDGTGARMLACLRTVPAVSDWFVFCFQLLIF
jgi:hypothetical protein